MKQVKVLIDNTFLPITDPFRDIKKHYELKYYNYKDMNCNEWRIHNVLGALFH